MEKYQVIIKITAEKDLSKHKKAGNKATIEKILKILNELKFNPYVGTGKPEELKHSLKGYWSRRINLKDRLIYQVEDETVTVYVVSAMGHYDDK